jgi:hypothetical protein
MVLSITLQFNTKCFIVNYIKPDHNKKSRNSSWRLNKYSTFSHELVVAQMVIKTTLEWPRLELTRLDFIHE